jgi:hypothetical protein
VIAWLAKRKTLPVWRIDGQIDLSPHLHASAANRFVKMLGLTSREIVRVATGTIRSSLRWGVLGTEGGETRFGLRFARWLAEPDVECISVWVVVERSYGFCFHIESPIILLVK